MTRFYMLQKLMPDPCGAGFFLYKNACQIVSLQPGEALKDPVRFVYPDFCLQQLYRTSGMCCFQYVSGTKAWASRFALSQTAMRASMSRISDFRIMFMFLLLCSGTRKWDAGRPCVRPEKLV